MFHEFWLSVPSLFFRFHQSSSPKSSLYHSFSSVFSQLLVTRFCLADGKFQNLGNYFFSFDILMPLYYCVVAMINKFNKYIYIYI